MRMLTFVILVFAGQATVCVLRERGHFRRSRLASVMLFASSTDVTIVASLAIGGDAMAPLPPAIIGLLFVATLAFAFALDFVKVTVFSCLSID